MLDHVPVKVVETPIWKMILPPGRDLGYCFFILLKDSVEWAENPT